MNLFVRILKIVVPSLRFWVLPAALWFGQAEGMFTANVPANTASEVAYLTETENGLADTLANLSELHSEEAVVPHSPPAKLTLFFFVLLPVEYADLSALISTLQVDDFINSYVRNVFYVFVTALAP